MHICREPTAARWDKMGMAACTYVRPSRGEGRGYLEHHGRLEQLGRNLARQHPQNDLHRKDGLLERADRASGAVDVENLGSGMRRKAVRISRCLLAEPCIP